MRGQRLKKFIQAITLLSQPTGTTLDELGRRLEIERRAVYRLIESFQDDFGFVWMKKSWMVAGNASRSEMKLKR